MSEDECILRVSKTKKEEIIFFLEEYNQFEKEKYDFYYIIPFEWLKCWDTYITDTFSEENKFDTKISNSHLVDEDKIIKQNLIENVDYAIIPKNIAFYFHDLYKGDRRLKTKNRHIYEKCEKNEACEKHDLKSILKLFKYSHYLEEDIKNKNRVRDNENEKENNNEGIPFFRCC